MFIICFFKTIDVKKHYPQDMIFEIIKELIFKVIVNFLKHEFLFNTLCNFTIKLPYIIVIPLFKAFLKIKLYFTNLDIIYLLYIIYFYRS